MPWVNHDQRSLWPSRSQRRVYNDAENQGYRE
jgi:hypothetical protein